MTSADNTVDRGHQRRKLPRDRHRANAAAPLATVAHAERRRGASSSTRLDPLHHLSLLEVHCAIRCPVIRREAAAIAHAWSMQSIIKVSWIVGFIKIGHQIRDPRWRKPLGTYPGPGWMSPPP